jgi:hypothetical protein
MSKTVVKPDGGAENVEGEKHPLSPEAFREF